MKKFLSLLLSILVIFIIASCGNKTTNSVNGTTNSSNANGGNNVNNPKVEISVKDYGKMQFELDPSQAPITVENFLKLTREGFYNNLTFHRIIKDFMIQGGDITGTGYGKGDEETIKGEFSSNGVDNTLKHTRGVISMARSGNPNSASTQFFIIHKDSPHLDGDYAAFGKVFAGMSAVDKIAEVETDEDDRPLKEQKIKSIRFIEIEE